MVGACCGHKALQVDFFNGALHEHPPCQLILRLPPLHKNIPSTDSLPCSNERMVKRLPKNAIVAADKMDVRGGAVFETMATKFRHTGGHDTAGHMSLLRGMQAPPFATLTGTHISTSPKG